MPGTLLPATLLAAPTSHSEVSSRNALIRFYVSLIPETSLRDLIWHRHPPRHPRRLFYRLRHCRRRRRLLDRRRTQRRDLSRVLRRRRRRHPAISLQ